MKPWLVRRLVHPLHEAVLRRPTFPYLRMLERTQWLSRAELEALQLQRLGELLRQARDHCPWHAQRLEAAGLDPNTDFTLEDFRRLPTMDKQDIREHGNGMVWREVPGGAHRYTTGGSSGQPLVFYFGRRRQASDAAGRMRARRWWGVEVGEPEVYLWGAPVELNKADLVRRVRDRLFNQLVLNAFEMSRRNMDEYLEAIRGVRPRCIYGYASSLALLAAHAREKGGVQVPGLRVVCTTGEPLYPHQRSLISEAFGVPVANEFGSRDIGFTAHESPAGQMLLMSESILLEVLDAQGRPVPPGEAGEAVMTGLCSEAQPFIRYRTGDMVRLSDEPCREGRGLHVIGEVLGRTTDFVVRADGTIMHALALIYVLRELPTVAEFRIVQHEVDRLEVMVVPAAGWSERDAARVRAGLQARLGEEVKIELRLLESIPAAASGKYRYVVSHVGLPDSLCIATDGPEGRNEEESE